MARRKPNPNRNPHRAHLPAVWLSLWLLALWLILPSRCLFAQFTPTTPLRFVIADPAGACTANSPMRYNTLNGKLWGCDALTWTAISGAGGATIPSVTNLIKGDGAGNGADSGIAATTTGTGAIVLATSPTLTTPAITTSETVTNNALGTSPAGGATIQNTTAAAVGAQQTSPPLFFCGNGWKTTATAASQQTCWMVSNLPVQGTTNPASLLSFAANTNGGAYTNYFTLQGDGVNAGVANFTTGTTLTSAGAITANNGGAFQLSAAGWTALSGVGATNGGMDLGQGHGVYWASGNTNQAASGDTSFCREGAGLVQVSAGTCNTTTAANYRDLKLRHALASGTAPTLTAGTGTIAGADDGGRVTLTAGSQTTITITFGTAYATNIPACTANDETTAVLIKPTASLTTLVLAASFGASDKIVWTCRGFL